MRENKKEITDLISDIGEHLEYMREIGVTEISADLPVIPNRPEPRHRPSRPVIVQRADSDDRVLASEIGELISRKKNSIENDSSATRRPARRNLLGGTKISDMKTKPENTAAVSTKDVKPAESPKPENKTVETKSAAPSIVAGTETLADIRAEIGSDCSRCELCEKRTQVVNSIGSGKAELMIVGEAPGADEDAMGEPFVGRAGKLLTKILEAIDFDRDDVFIGNINRCRPPDNRQPTLEESATCKPFLLREIEVVKPKVIVVLGNTATKNLLDTKTGITKLRGDFVERFGVKVMPTFHPAYLLRDPRKKREVWEDMKKVREYLNSVSD